jgi:hypothetical protein
MLDVYQRDETHNMRVVNIGKLMLHWTVPLHKGQNCQIKRRLKPRRTKLMSKEHEGVAPPITEQQKIDH